MIVFTNYLDKNIGGVGQLIANTVIQLNKIGLQAKIYCSIDSYEYIRLVKENAKFIFIDSAVVKLNDLRKFINKDDVICITHINNTPLLEAIKDLNNKMFFYSVHPDTFFCYPKKMNFLCNQRNAAFELIKGLQDKKGLYLMDGVNVDGINKRKSNLINYKEVKYIPIPIIYYNKLQRNGRLCERGLNITYIGRGNSDWKIYPVIKFLQDLNIVNKNVIFTIITEKNTRFEELIKVYIPNNIIKIQFINGLYGEELEKYLYLNSSLHISMGTSALEAAKLGIPTILVDFSQKPYPENYLYNWIYQTENYSLGRDITGLNHFEGMSISEIFETVESEEKYSDCSNRCHQYVKNNHSIESYINLLIKASENTEYRVSDYCKSRFSINMKYINPVIKYLSKIKRFFIHNIVEKNM